MASIIDSYQKTQKGWYEIGGKRIYLKSQWEVKYAYYLEWLKQGGKIVDWKYEPKIFYFDGIRRGTTNYTPDFEVHLLNGTLEYHEVKGFFDQKSLTKIKRMEKYYPEIVLKVFEKEWFSGMNDKLGGFVQGWNKTRSRANVFSGGAKRKIPVVAKTKDAKKVLIKAPLK